VPLGEARFASCPFCRAETPIPELHLAAQRAARGFAADRKLAEQLYGRVGKPPGPIARAVSRGVLGAAHGGAKAAPWVLVLMLLVHPVIGFFMVTGVAWLLGYPVAAAIRAGFWIAHRSPPGPIPPLPILLLTTFLLAFGFGIPFVIVSRARALASVRAAVHAGLAASLPERPGGPSRCRQCGAALDVPKGALGVPCVYCRADNLVALSEEWVTLVRRTELGRFLQIDGALGAFRAASEEASRRVWQLGFGFLLAVPVVAFIAYALDVWKVTY
jgi:hypothetical protein